MLCIQRYMGPEQKAVCAVCGLHWTFLSTAFVVATCAVVFHYMALFPKGNKTKTFIRGLYWTFNERSPQSSKLPSCRFESEHRTDETGNGQEGITVSNESRPYLRL